MYEKSVVVRFSQDVWKSFIDVPASYKEPFPRQGGYDMFRFEVAISMPATACCNAVLCVRYTVGGMDYWDNNGGQNFDILFLRRSG